MLTIAIATFFALAFAGALLTIVMMFHAYQDKIKAVIATELGEAVMQSPVSAPRYRSQTIKPQLAAPFPAKRRRSFQPAPLRVAA